MRILVLFFFCSSVVFSQQTDVVDFTNISAFIRPDIQNREVEGEVSVSFTMLKQADSIYLDAVGINHIENRMVDSGLRASDDKLWIISDFEKDKTYSIHFGYTMTPKRALYFTYDQVWTQGQGKYTSNWLPSIDDMNDKIEFDLKFVAEKGKTVIANGRGRKYEEHAGSTVWSFNMDQPMSSYLVAFAIGDFVKKEIQSESGIPIELYLRTEDSLKMEPTYRHTKEIFDFFEQEIGVPYPWQNYKQVPVRDFLYAGMENTTATLFSEAFVVDSIGFHDRNYVNVNAHELAHQWFGNLVTETEGKHHWLHEGFATYYALLAERHLFGDDYYYWKLYNTAEQLRALSEQGKGQSLLNPKASSLTFYEKGAWALHMLNERIGRDAFREAVKNYLEKYQFKNVTTENFLSEVRAVAQVNISDWEKDWLKQSAFKGEQALNSLTQSKFLTQYFDLVALREMTLEDKRGLLVEALQSGNEYLAEEAIIQLALEKGAPAVELYKVAFQGSITTRQAVALSMDPPILDGLKAAYESLLDDRSYSTQETALYVLWASYPEERSRFLDKMKYVHGFQDKNIRLLWLTLALSTDNYATSAKPLFENELRNYSRPEYSYEIRENAFQYISSLGNWNEEVLRNLVNGCTHHYWRFRDFCRDMLNELMETRELKQYLKSKMETFPEKEKAYLKRVI
ncbi:MAG: M1 family metallopeptidase [Flavobacteriaceae bacterium]|nr:M1 family metallopeptidase [Flavobacteriaceae bacterium]